MDFLPFSDFAGNPNSDAVFTNATLVSALYHGDRRPFERIAELTQSQLVLFEQDPQSFQPDVAVLVKPGAALIVFDGTTNFAQWMSHLASSFFPLFDRSTGNTVVGSFFAGLRRVEGRILDAIRPALRGSIQCTGHSYGAGAAKLFCDHLAVSQQPPQSLELMTFGEPRSSGNFLANSPTYVHFRICGKINFRTIFPEAYGLDPVTFCPPGIMTCYKWPLTTTIPLGLLGFKWKFFGKAFQLNDSGLSPTGAYDLFTVTFDLTGWLWVGENTPYAYLHFMDTWYLSKALMLWQASNQIQ